ncbi:MAG: peptidoglycan DD-metalloendopeptidase family protein [Oscillospiraceae bacterium]|nr:peptidoglycan DD-metalloendopeptidase family protein [Oscillospiraceae bacterium]
MKISKKIIAVLLALVMLLSISLNGFAVSKEEIEANLNAEIAQKEKEIEQYQQKIDSLKGNAEKQDEYIDELQKQIHAYDDEVALLGQQIDDLNAKIATLDGEIAEYEAKIKSLEENIEKINTQIEEKKVEVDDAYKLLSDRLCAAYMAGETSVLEIFLSAKDFSDFIERSELVYQIAKHDNEIVAGLRDSIAELNKMIVELDEQKADLEESKALLDSQRAELESSRETVKQSKAVVDQKVATIQFKINQVNSYIGSLNQQSARYQAMMKKANQDLADFEAQLGKLNTSTGSGTVDSSNATHNFEVSTKGLICPLQGAAVAIREYSWNHAKRGYGNRATDMGSKSGSTLNRPIYAVADGTVLSSAYQSVGGNYIVIDHGNGVSTRYFHCNSLAVSKGATVKQGQIIAYAGSTGSAATGPHLHFEVLVNGTQVAPENYLQKANGNYVSPIS